VPRVLCRILLVVGLVAALPLNEARAQVRDPISRYVIDVRGATMSLPTTEGWTPTIAGGVDVPGRGFGVELGGHVYPLRLGAMTLGLGGSWMRVRGNYAPDGETSPRGARAVTTTFSGLAPQISLNFGHRLGWSYLSGGVGRSGVQSVAEGMTTTPAESSKTVNYGGGARWFVRDRVAFSIDLRFHQLSPLPATLARPAGGRIKQFALLAGAAFR
jgi:hypothetical protein